MAEKWSEGLLVGTRPLRLAELICRMLVDRVRAVYGTLLLDVDTVWDGAVNTVLVKEGVTVSELRWGGESPGTLKPRTPGHSTATELHRPKALLPSRVRTKRRL